MGFVSNKIRTMFWTLFYYLFAKAFFVKIGRGCKFEGWVDIPQRGGKIMLGSYLHICRLVELSVPKGGTLILGDNVCIGRGNHITAHKFVEIGNDVMIAEYVCIHDNDHRFNDIDIPILKQGFISSPIAIGSGSWVGAQSTILRGAELGRDSVLGAGSLLNKKMPDFAVVAGCPAKVIKLRMSADAAERVS